MRLLIGLTGLMLAGWVSAGQLTNSTANVQSILDTAVLSTDGGALTYTTAQVEDTVRRTLNPNQVSLYLPAATNGIVLTGSIENKVAVTVIPAVAPVGFDLFTTPQGPAIRFVGGDGDPDGTDTNIVQVSMQMGITATSSSATTTFDCMTRPYTEAEFTNATVIAGCAITRKMANNDSGAMAIVAPLITMVDGDLLELSINPDSGITVTIEQLSVTVMEIN